MVRGVVVRMLPGVVVRMLPAGGWQGCRVAVGRVSGGLLSVWSGGLLSVCCRGLLSVCCRGLLSVWSGGLLSVWSRGLLSVERRGPVKAWLLERRLFRTLLTGIRHLRVPYRVWPNRPVIIRFGRGRLGHDVAPFN